MDGISSSAGGPREEAVRPLFVRDVAQIAANCVANSTRDVGVVVVEESEVCGASQVGSIGVGVDASSGVY